MPLSTEQALALMQIGLALEALDELLPKIDVAELPEHNQRGLTASLGKLHARIHLINQLTDTHTPTPHGS